MPINTASHELADCRSRAIVNHRRWPLACAAFGEIDADSIATAKNVFGDDPFGSQCADRRFSDCVRGESCDVAAFESELREAHRDIRFAAAKRRRQDGRLQEPLESRRAQAQHEFAEGDDSGRHHRVARAARTFATMRSALEVIVRNEPDATSFALTRAEPTPTATAPARIQSPALSTDTPPVGISLTCGNGARTSFRKAGPSAVAGNTLITSAPPSQAVRISVGVKHPGM